MTDTVRITIALPTGPRSPQAYRDAIHAAIAAATARGDSIGAHALAGLLALMMPFAHTHAAAIWHQAIARGFRDDRPMTEPVVLDFGSEPIARHDPRLGLPQDHVPIAGALNGSLRPVPRDIADAMVDMQSKLDQSDAMHWEMENRRSLEPRRIPVVDFGSEWIDRGRVEPTEPPRCPSCGLIHHPMERPIGCKPVEK